MRWQSVLVQTDETQQTSYCDWRALQPVLPSDDLRCVIEFSYCQYQPPSLCKWNLQNKECGKQAEGYGNGCTTAFNALLSLPCAMSTIVHLPVQWQYTKMTCHAPVRQILEIFIKLFNRVNMPIARNLQCCSIGNIKNKFRFMFMGSIVILFDKIPRISQFLFQNFQLLIVGHLFGSTTPSRITCYWSNTSGKVLRDKDYHQTHGRL